MKHPISVFIKPAAAHNRLSTKPAAAQPAIVRPECCFLRSCQLAALRLGCLSSNPDEPEPRFSSPELSQGDDKQPQPISRILMSRIANALSVFCVALGTVFIVSYVASYCRYGFDFTDESYYLISMTDPFYYDASVSQFGFVYRYLFDLFSGDIAMLRLANLALTFALAFSLSMNVVRLVGGAQSARWVRVVLSAGLATAGLISYLGRWTPNYNSLAFQGLLIVGVGLLTARPLLSRASLAAWMFIGVGGWLTFMAKPSTAAGVAVATSIYVLISGKLNLRGLIVAAATASLLVVLSAVIIDGSIIKFVSRVKLGFELTELSGGYSLRGSLRLDHFSLSVSEKFLAAVLFLSVAIAIYVSSIAEMIWDGWLKAAIAAISTVLTISIAWGWPTVIDASGLSVGLVILAIPAAAAVVFVLLFLHEPTVSQSRERWAAVVLFMALPLIYAYGSNNNYWYLSCTVGFFWGLAGALLVRIGPTAWSTVGRVVPVVLAVQFTAMLFLFTYVQQPFRQPQPLWLNDQPMTIGNSGSVLMLASGFAAHIRDVRAKAADAGFKAGTPILDLTGLSPGLVFALRARSAGSPWLVGGYPGSADVARSTIARMPCADMSRAWIFVAPDGPRAISVAVLDAIGASLDRDYVLAATWRTAAGVAGYPEERLQQFWKPNRPQHDALAACEGVRRTAR